VDYFCEAKPQNGDLQTVECAKRTVLQRFVKFTYTENLGFLFDLMPFLPSDSLPMRAEKARRKLKLPAHTPSKYLLPPLQEVHQ